MFKRILLVIVVVAGVAQVGYEIPNVTAAPAPHPKKPKGTPSATPPPAAELTAAQIECLAAAEAELQGAWAKAGVGLQKNEWGHAYAVLKEKHLSNQALRARCAIPEVTR